MKILLTVVGCGQSANGNAEPLYDGIEIIYPEKDETQKEFLARAVKGAKGKFTVICDRAFLFGDVQPLLNIIDKNATDMVCFNAGTAFKTSILKACVKDCTDAFSLKMLAVMNCKNLLKTTYAPFSFDKVSGKFTQENIAGILLCAETFSNVKAKLNKEIYTYASNKLCARLIIFYMSAMLAVKDGDMKAEKLIEFDNKLKAEIVLFLAVDKRFTAAKLSKLRNKGFKISGLTAKKFRKLLK